MKSIYLSIIVLLITVSAFAQENTWSPTVENTKIISEQEFFTTYEETTQWKHIIRLKRENPSVVFESGGTITPALLMSKSSRTYSLLN